MMNEDIHKWSDGRYVLMFDEHTFFVWDNEKDERMTALNVTKKLNEQQATINRMKESLDTIYKAFEKHYGYDMRNAVWLIDEISYDEFEDKLHIAETDGKNRKEASMYWKKKCDEQQDTIRRLQDLCGESDSENMKLRIENKRLKEEKEYWESKAMTLLMQVRRLTSRMTDKEVKEFKKELEDE